MKILLLHGKDTAPNEKWYPWFKEQIEQRGISCTVPELPKSSDPHIKDWLVKINEAKPNSETVLVGHSRGGVAILRWLEQAPASLHVKKVILIATNPSSSAQRSRPEESNYGFYTDSEYDFKKIKTHCDDFVVYHSQDDQWVPFSAGVQNALGLDAKFRVFKNKGHFGENLNGTFPELLEEFSEV